MGVEVKTTRPGNGKDFPKKVRILQVPACLCSRSERGKTMFLPQGDALTMHYRGTLTNGKQFDASYDRGQPFKFQIGVGQVKALFQRVIGSRPLARSL